MVKYYINLNYGYEQTESGIFHSFIALSPDMHVNDNKMETLLAIMLDADPVESNFDWNSTFVDLPDDLIEKIKQDAIKEYLEKNKEEH